MKKSAFRHLRNKWVIALIVVILLIVILSVIHARNAKPSIDTAVAALTDVRETVSVTGTVSPIDKSDLSFQKGGVIAEIYHQVGDQVKKGDPIASLDSAADQAALASAQATLADMTRGLTKQELEVQTTALSNAETDAVNASHEAFVTAQSAVFNQTDAFFSGAQSTNPIISIHTEGQVVQLSIDAERLTVSTVFDRWGAELSHSATMDPATLAADSLGYLGAIKGFMTDLSGIVSALNPVNSGQPQPAIDTDLSTMNTALASVNTAIDTVTTASTALASAKAAYDLKLAGNSSESIAAQSAKVAQAQAALDDDTIVAPFEGIVTKADPHVGEYAAPGDSGFAVQDSSFKIEAPVAEADIAKVAVGDLASTTLDAYGSDTDFPAQVTAIDPAETVIEGVPTYKVTLHFLAPDPRIRSGMTANLEILTHERQGVLAIPYRAVSTGDGSSTVLLLDPGGKSWTSVPVTTGLKGSDGSIEIVSGLQPGDTVVTYVK